MNQHTSNTRLSILNLPDVVTQVFERAHRPLLPGARNTPGLFVRYLRRKPARGLAVIYHVDEIGKPDKAHANDPHRAVSLTLDEKALDGAQIRFNEAEAEQAAIEVEPSGVLRAETIGLSVQAFPADSGLPALAASCDMSNDQVRAALERAAHLQLQDERWKVVSAQAIPVRYKPANRCVIRYELELEQEGANEPARKHLTIFGKVYADPQQAKDVQALQQQLYDEQKAKGGPFLPRPLAIVEELGLTFNEAVQPTDPNEHMLTGTRALRPHMERGRGGEITRLIIPVEELQLTARALARLHTSRVHPEGAPRTGAKEAKRARERASLIASHNPAQSAEVQRLATRLAERLEVLRPDTYRPAHGGFKASQLLFHSHRVFVVDFDGFCQADAALDVGYFLAYLRPSGLWYQRQGMRAWFEEAASVFKKAYRDVMLEAGASEEALEGILQRSRLYEAALLFKIATRRVNRLNSPRSKELAAMMEEVAACLAE